MLTSKIKEDTSNGENGLAYALEMDVSTKKLDEQTKVESSTIALTELQQIDAIQRMNSNFIFLFGAAHRGKTVVTSSVLNFLSSVESEGDLAPFAVKKDVDHGNDLYRKILRVFAEKRFPLRTVLVGNDEPIYVNVRFTPHNQRDKEALNLTFLEMPGDHLARIDAPEGGRGELPASIDIFFRTKGVSISFILITEHGLAAQDDQLIASFIDRVRHENKNFSNARFLLLVTKWDEYDGGLPVDEFVKLNMRLTHSKLHDSKHSISDFSIGEVGTADEKPFLQSYNSIAPRKVINWLYTNITGKPMYQKKFLDKLLSKFLKYT